ncbi:MAG: hypothetical protein HKN00_12180 [Flavobacteriaceae bacterium]|nr:hypothetical protein [Bacteroidia bacterium]NNF75938.1 hypothetical protein [Flavobacteriaceae bacterium]NNK72088.1 hypothetical protein [Flavobacteriaceae bacterium]
MNDKSALIGTVAFILFFLLAGILGISDNPLVKALLFLGFLAIVIHIVMTKAKDRTDKKNPPE